MIHPASRAFHSSLHALNNTHYHTLGLARTVDKNTIKLKFYELSKKYHPDLRPNDEAAKQKYLAISSAYDILGNESKRKQYDLTLSPVPTYQNPYASTSHNPYTRSGRPSSWVHPSTRTAPRPRSSPSSNPSAYWPLNHRRPRQPFSPPPGNASHFGPYVNPDSYHSTFDRQSFENASRPMSRSRSTEFHREERRIPDESELPGIGRAFGIGLLASVAIGIGAGFSGTARREGGL